MQKEVNLPFNKLIANKSKAPLLNDILEVVEQASISCYDWIGKGDNHLADQAAVNSMRLSLNKMPRNIRGGNKAKKGKNTQKNQQLLL